MDKLFSGILNSVECLPEIKNREENKTDLIRLLMNIDIEDLYDNINTIESFIMKDIASMIASKNASNSEQRNNLNNIVYNIINLPSIKLKRRAMV